VEYPLKFQWKNFAIPICMSFTGNPFIDPLSRIIH